MRFVIYGAQAIALGVCRAFDTLFKDIEIPCFVVTERGINPERLAGRPVMELPEFAESGLYQDAEILICTPENVMSAIEVSLDERGLTRHVRMTSMRFAELMSFFYTASGEFRPLSQFPIGSADADVEIYIAKFYRDKVLSTATPMPDFYTPIQVGAALTDIQVANIRDNVGENISERNVNYSELTALYWIWRNVLEQGCDKDYVGLAHYRRFLSLSDDDLLRLRANDIDAVLPFPMPYEPDIEEHHKRYLSDTDWEALMRAMREIHPEDMDAIEAVLKQDYMCNYNIMLAKPEVLRDYCEWLFPVLFRTEELSVPKGNERADRYIGYMGEMLTTLYFMSRRNRLRIAYAGCRFLT